MPREIVEATPQLSGGDKCGVSVGWAREQYVQLGSCKDRDDNTGIEGYFVDLDRQQINKLIRLLRKARDQAYGADA